MDAPVGKVVMVACGSYAASAVNDILMLTIMYAESLQIDSTFRPVHVAIGQYIGLTCTIAISMLGLVASSFISPQYMGLLGVAPLLMGLYKYLQMLGRWCRGEEVEDITHEVEVIEELEVECGLKTPPRTSTSPRHHHDHEAEARALLQDGVVGEAAHLLHRHGHDHEVQGGGYGYGYGGTTLIEEGHRQHSCNHDDDEEEEKAMNAAPPTPPSLGPQSTSSLIRFRQGLRLFLMETFCNLGILKAALMVLLNGSDNITVYTPLFATRPAWQIRVIIGVFYVLVGIWCGFGYALIRVPHIAKAIARWGHYVVPGVFMGIGLAILWDDDCIDLVTHLVHKAQDLHQLLINTTTR